MYVADHCCCVDTGIRQDIPGETYDIGGQNELANIDMCHLICSLMYGPGVKDSLSRDLICFVDDRLGHDWRYPVGTGKKLLLN